ncbi:hypothetical protein OP861_06825 [Yersinia intermedia]|uniref:hypothetical protein n=1 Tax=Yersinia intermedia TaxID=631 RepID=UPI00223EDCED|nr:hypothetical protein [Yersinia intermedia]UZM72351.1 hypothetical protein OP861_06825 [Yersinia intermedia]
MKYNKTILRLSALLFTLTLIGCQTSSSRLKKPPSQQLAQNPSQRQLEVTQLQQCQKGLEVLGTIQPQKSTPYKQAFDHLMNSAAQYSGVRLRVSTETQNTVDALYRYRVSKLCAEINQAVLLGLTERAEVVQ